MRKFLPARPFLRWLKILVSAALPEARVINTEQTFGLELRFGIRFRRRSVSGLDPIRGGLAADEGDTFEFVIGDQPLQSRTPGSGPNGSFPRAAIVPEDLNGGLSGPEAGTSGGDQMPDRDEV